jgi:hypothetical protein
MVNGEANLQGTIFCAIITLCDWALKHFLGFNVICWSFKFDYIIWNLKYLLLFKRGDLLPLYLWFLVPCVINLFKEVFGRLKSHSWHHPHHFIKPSLLVLSWRTEILKRPLSSEQVISDHRPKGVGHYSHLTLESLIFPTVQKLAIVPSCFISDPLQNSLSVLFAQIEEDVNHSLIKNIPIGICSSVRVLDSYTLNLGLSFRCFEEWLPINHTCHKIVLTELEVFALHLMDWVTQVLFVYNLVLLYCPYPMNDQK